MGTRFEDCLALILQFEGGYSDNPDDPGGATCDGIEQPEYDTYRESIGETAQTVADITTTEAGAIYAANYWAPTHAPYLQSPLDVVMFDSAVNCGVGTAIKWLQAALGIPQTRVFDNDTSAAYHLYDNAHGTTPLAQAVLRQRVAYYETLPQKNPALAEFLQGWLNRVNELQRCAGLAE